MGYCGPRGIPHSHFLGGPAVWSQADRDKALWWHMHQLESCPSCGTRKGDWDEDREAFAAEFVHCRGCEVLGRAQKDLDDHPKQFRRGTRAELRRNLPITDVSGEPDG